MVCQEVEDRLKQPIQPLSADLSLPPGLEKKLKTGQKTLQTTLWGHYSLPSTHVREGI